MFARVAGFPTVKTLDGFDTAFATGAPRQQIAELASLAFAERTENVVFFGPLGAGKTHLAIARLPLDPARLEGTLHHGRRPDSRARDDAAPGPNRQLVHHDPGYNL